MHLTATDRYSAALYSGQVSFIGKHITPLSSCGIISFMENARAHIVISGKVQGVFYRAFTEDAAHSLGLKGWVKNCSDGKVEALFEGEKENIEKAIRLCYKGPPAAKVNNIDVKWEIFKGEFDTFSVRYF